MQQPDRGAHGCEVVAEFVRTLTSGVTIRPDRLDDLSELVELERAAGESSRSLGMDLTDDDDPGS